MGAHGDEHREILDRLHERGRQRAGALPEFDAGKTISRAYAVRDAGAVNFWNVLSPTERSAFERAARLRTFRPGSVLMREGEPAEGVVVILDGWVRVCLSEDGREQAIAERGPGDLVGERGTALGNVRSATVIALGTVQALVMETADIEHGRPGVPLDPPGGPRTAFRLIG